MAASPAELLFIGLAGVLVVLVAVMAVRAWKASRPTAAEIERRRRLSLNAMAKMGDATLIEAREQLVFYSYDVRGVEYTASQDISALREFLPSDPVAMHGPVYVKYDPRNPANSIIVCEAWSGFFKGETKR